jgi:ADP-ribose pyrophosphatase YjhB (NUDIX family)
MSAQQDITRAAWACIIDRALLFVEEDNNLFTLPGGKPFAREDYRVCLAREVKEETHAELVVSTIRLFRQFTDEMADGRRVHHFVHFANHLRRHKLYPGRGVKRLVMFTSKDKHLTTPANRDVIDALFEMDIID